MCLWKIRRIVWNFIILQKPFSKVNRNGISPKSWSNLINSSNFSQKAGTTDQKIAHWNLKINKMKLSIGKVCVHLKSGKYTEKCSVDLNFLHIFVHKETAPVNNFPFNVSFIFPMWKLF